MTVDHKEEIVGVNPMAKTTSQEVEDETKEPPLSKPEVVKRLRSMGCPVTLFGETDWMRYKRLRKMEQEKLDDVVQGVGGEGNTFQKDLQLNEEEYNKELNDTDEDKRLLESFERIRHIEGLEQEYRGRRKPNIAKDVPQQQKCDDIYVWCRKLLQDWEKDLASRSEEEKNTVEGRQGLGNYRQCRRHIKPLFQLLKDKSINEEIMDALFHITHYCIAREYIKAHDKYLELAIGNSPWPMGVTMVGIHERSGRAKIFSSQVAHILNDETQRKYIQSIKRLMTFSQQKYPPNDPTKMVKNQKC
eukprot:TRINITY_DN2140_c0_g1_i6.p2 TRINITY_DN2140_c0_g1~~TRINITY_DN2140_c0_g1_i6.p2  ORF type:complete len:302 (+),score=48.78 TRINITY_DN2140_c0_g1_i6:290-1195(+)